MLSQSRLQRQRLQRCRIYPQVGDKSHWNSRERVLEPEELSFLGGPPTSDTETREGAKRAAEGASPLRIAIRTTKGGLAPARPNNVSNSFRIIPNCSRGHGGCSAASLGMLSQSRLQRQRLQRCRIYPQVGDKSHWNSRERVLEPEELSFLGGPPTSDTETREGAKRAAEGASPLTYAWANTSLTLAPQCLQSPSF